LLNQMIENNVVVGISHVSSLLPCRRRHSKEISHRLPQESSHLPFKGFPNEKGELVWLALVVRINRSF